MEPRSWRQYSFADWLKRCKAMDEWDELLQSVPSYEWNIHRKLGEAAGLAHRYIIPARGSGKSMFVNTVADSFDDPKKILRKHREEREPQEFVTIKDGDIEKWLQKELNQKVVEDICAMFRDIDRREATTRYLTSFNPYLQPEGYWYDPSWDVRLDGSIVMRELSIMPGYLLDKEEE